MTPERSVTILLLTLNVFLVKSGQGLHMESNHGLPQRPRGPSVVFSVNKKEPLTFVQTPMSMVLVKRAKDVITEATARPMHEIFDRADEALRQIVKRKQQEEPSRPETMSTIGASNLRVSRNQLQMYDPRKRHTKAVINQEKVTQEEHSDYKLIRGAHLETAFITPLPKDNPNKISERSYSYSPPASNKARLNYDKVDEVQDGQDKQKNQRNKERTNIRRLRTRTRQRYSKSRYKTKSNSAEMRYVTPALNNDQSSKTPASTYKVVMPQQLELNRDYLQTPLVPDKQLIVSSHSGYDTGASPLPLEMLFPSFKFATTNTPKMYTNVDFQASSSDFDEEKNPNNDLSKNGKGNTENSLNSSYIPPTKEANIHSTSLPTSYISLGQDHLRHTETSTHRQTLMTFDQGTGQSNFEDQATTTSATVAYETPDDPEFVSVTSSFVTTVSPINSQATSSFFINDGDTYGVPKAPVQETFPLSAGFQDPTPEPISFEYESSVNLDDSTVQPQITFPLMTNYENTDNDNLDLKQINQQDDGERNSFISFQETKSNSQNRNQTLSSLMTYEITGDSTKETQFNEEGYEKKTLTLDNFQEATSPPQKTEYETNKIEESTQVSAWSSDKTQNNRNLTTQGKDIILPFYAQSKSRKFIPKQSIIQKKLPEDAKSSINFRLNKETHSSEDQNVSNNLTKSISFSPEEFVHETTTLYQIKDQLPTLSPLNQYDSPRVTTVRPQRTNPDAFNVSPNPFEENDSYGIPEAPVISSTSSKRIITLKNPFTTTMTTANFIPKTITTEFVASSSSKSTESTSPGSKTVNSESTIAISGGDSKVLEVSNDSDIQTSRTFNSNTGFKRLLSDKKESTSSNTLKESVNQSINLNINLIVQDDKTTIQDILETHTTFPDPTVFQSSEKKTDDSIRKSQTSLYQNSLKSNENTFSQPSTFSLTSSTPLSTYSFQTSNPNSDAKGNLNITVGRNPTLNSSHIGATKTTTRNYESYNIFTNADTIIKNTNDQKNKPSYFNSNSFTATTKLEQTILPSSSPDSSTTPVSKLSNTSSFSGNSVIEAKSEYTTLAPTPAYETSMDISTSSLPVYSRQRSRMRRKRPRGQLSEYRKPSITFLDVTSSTTQRPTTRYSALDLTTTSPNTRPSIKAFPNVKKNTFSPVNSYAAPDYNQDYNIDDFMSFYADTTENKLPNDLDDETRLHAISLILKHYGKDLVEAIKEELGTVTSPTSASVQSSGKNSLKSSWPEEASRTSGVSNFPNKAAPIRSSYYQETLSQNVNKGIPIKSPTAESESSSKNFNKNKPKQKYLIPNKYKRVPLSHVLYLNNPEVSQRPFSKNRAPKAYNDNGSDQTSKNLSSNRYPNFKHFENQNDYNDPKAEIVSSNLPNKKGRANQNENSGSKTRDLHTRSRYKKFRSHEYDSRQGVVHGKNEDHPNQYEYESMKRRPTPKSYSYQYYTQHPVTSTSSSTLPPSENDNTYLKQQEVEPPALYLQHGPPYVDVSAKRPLYEQFGPPYNAPKYHAVSYEKPPPEIRNEYIKSFYDVHHDLIPDLQEVARPIGWNVQDFSSWESMFSKYKTALNSKVYNEHSKRNYFTSKKVSGMPQLTNPFRKYEPDLDRKQDYDYKAHRRVDQGSQSSHGKNPRDEVEEDPSKLDFEVWLAKFGIHRVSGIRRRRRRPDASKTEAIHEAARFLKDKMWSELNEKMKSLKNRKAKS